MYLPFLRIDLRQQLRRVAEAKIALGLDVLGGDRLASSSSEMIDLREVWMSLSQPWEDLSACGETAWNAVIPRKIRASLEGVLQSLRELPNMTRQYAAFEHFQELVKGHVKANSIVTDLRSQAMKDR